MLFLPILVVMTICTVHLQPGFCQQELLEATPIIKNPPSSSAFGLRNPITKRIGDAEVNSPSISDFSTLNLEKKVKLKIAEECGRYVVAETEIWMSKSIFNPNMINCSQHFQPANAESKLKLECPIVYFRFGCEFESLTIEGENRTTQICGEEYVPTTKGKEITVIYTRNLFGLHGGYICFLHTIKDKETTKQENNTTTLDPALTNTTTEKPKLGHCFTCGKTVTQNSTQMTTKIVGGHTGKRGDFPWMAYLRIVTKEIKSYVYFYCGGSLITDMVVLTAAHCLEKTNIDRIEIILGAHILTDESESGRLRLTSRNFRFHQDYDKNQLINDIALIYFDSPIIFNQFIQPICLPTENETNLDGVVATGAGWGTTAFKGQLSTTLRYVELPITTQAKCKLVWSFSGIHIQDDQVCAFEKDKDTCTGDSGGPLFAKFQNKSVVVGVVSYGRECAHKIYPGVYTRVLNFRPWIIDNLPYSSCP